MTGESLQKQIINSKARVCFDDLLVISDKNRTAQYQIKMLWINIKN